MNFPVDTSQVDLIKVLMQDQALISYIGLMLILLEQHYVIKVEISKFLAISPMVRFTAYQRRSGSPDPCVGTYSPHYVPTTPPERSSLPICSPATTLVQTGPSVIASLSFDIHSLHSSARKEASTPYKASAVALPPPDSTEMQVDSPGISPADARAIAEALYDPAPRVRLIILSLFHLFRLFLAWLTSLCCARQEKLSLGCTSRASYLFWHKFFLSPFFLTHFSLSTALG
jgi:hypothetical protein